MVFLGLDYGHQRIGVAIAVNSIIGTKGWLDWKNKEEIFLRKIKKLCQEERVDKVVVGMSRGSIGEEIKQFVNRLSLRLKLPIELVNETLTSWDAEKIVGWKNKGRVDSVSAALILERYLSLCGDNNLLSS